MDDFSASTLLPRLEDLIDEHHQALYRYAFRLTGTAADAEDLTQQTFLIAQQKRTQIREAQSIRGWLFSVLRNCYLQLCRQNIPLPATCAQLELDQLAEASWESAWDTERLQAALDELPGEYKVVVLMFYFEQLAYREIAALLELPIGTIMSRLSRGKAHLRARLLQWDAADTRRDAVSGANETTMPSPLAGLDLLAATGDPTCSTRREGDSPLMNSILLSTNSSDGRQAASIAAPQTSTAIKH